MPSRSTCGGAFAAVCRPYPDHAAARHVFQPIVLHRADPAAAERGQDGPTPRQVPRSRGALRPVAHARPGAGAGRPGHAVRRRPGRGGRRPGGTQDPARPRRAQRRACARAPTARADAVYAGVLYDALGLATLSAGARRRATSRVRVISSLFGLVAPTDRIPAYRLSGDAVLPGLGTVAGVWREALGPEITDAGRRRAPGRPAQRDVRRVLAADRPAQGGAPSACSTRSPAGGRWSATSTRRPRAGSSARCSRTARTRAPRPGWPRRCATSAGTSRWRPARRAWCQLDVVVSEL